MNNIVKQENMGSVFSFSAYYLTQSKEFLFQLKIFFPLFKVNF